MTVIFIKIQNDAPHKNLNWQSTTFLPHYRRLHQRTSSIPFRLCGIL